MLLLSAIFEMPFTSRLTEQRVRAEDEGWGDESRLQCFVAAILGIVLAGFG
jgi:hypothetical protein